ncbi:MAG: 2OG-Fe(II) oxygenase [Alphaproteobacteria bacterium]
MSSIAADESLLPKLASRYQSAEVFPHIVIDGFWDSKELYEATSAFPALSGEAWIHYQHFNENKGGLNKRHAIPSKLLHIIDTLNAPDFISWLSKLTGISHLIPDPDLEGGGLHQIKPGGFLNVHADFTVHPHRRMWRRRVNLLLYLNENWDESYGGKLELWTKDMKRPFEEILPIFNRCVIFNTDADSYHGHPKPLTCPEGITRKSIALYYFTEEKEKPTKVATNYRSRPDDGIKALFIYLDKWILAVYNWVKGVLGINDDFVSKVLRALAKLRGK